MALEWKVLPHDPIRKLEDNLWLVEGELDGMPIGRKMVVIKLSDGRLVIHNAMALNEDAMKEIEGWGTPAYLIVPNAFHRIDAPRYKERYPSLKVLCPPGAAAKVAERVAVDGVVADLPAGLGLSAQVLDGTGEAEAAFLVDHGGRTSLVVTDAFFNLPDKGGFHGFMLRLVGSSGGPKVTRIFKFMAMKDGAALKAHLERLAATPGLGRLIMAHGQIVEEGAAATLTAVAQTI